MRLATLALFFLLPGFGLHGADADALVQQALVAEARFDTKTALNLFLQADAARPGDGLILQKIARQYSDLDFEAPNETEKRRLVTLALGYAQRAAAAQPKNAVNVLSVAICHGKLATLSDTRTKIAYSRLVKQHAEEAVTLDPNYDYAHHVLGRWHYEVASVGGAARFFAKLIYDELPSASTAEAVRHLRRAVELAPSLPSHRVELGFALLADGQSEAARTVFQDALKLPQREKHDVEAWQRARQALEKL